MNLGQRLTLIIFVTLGIWIACTFLPIFQYDPILRIATITFLCLFMLLLTNLWIIDPIRQLNQELNKNQLLTELKGNNELTEIRRKLNTRIKASHESMSHERLKMLEKTNTKLAEELDHLALYYNKMQGGPNAKNKQQSTLPKLAHYDELTSLPNRIFFNEILNKSISHAKRHHTISALLLIDINDFKIINVAYGNEIGDLVLKEIANRLSNSLRSEDILARLEGDEFIILLNGIGQAKFASSVAEKIINICANPFKIEDKVLQIKISIGISIYPNDGDSLEDLLKHADKALITAKSNLNNAYQFYTDALDKEARTFKTLDTALKKSIKNNELMLYYQPQLNLKTGRIIGIEALIRWNHPEFGMVNPSIFIPIANETGFIMEMGAWALREACRLNKHWQDEGYEHMSVAINLSAQQFHHPDITKIIQGALDETHLSPDYLQLEINEATVMNKVEESSIILSAIKKTGVQIAIDHFGIGHTSISYLKKFPINTIKIDQSYIKGIPLNPEDMAITNAFISLGHPLGLTVIAEGVETAEQVEYLTEQNCDIIQGYFLSHPMPEEKIEKQFSKISDEVLP